MNKQQLSAKIWESANKMRSKIEANEYKDYILGFIFYKFLSEKEEEFLYENDWNEETLTYLVENDDDTLNYVRNNIGYFISYDNLFSTWIKKGVDLSINDVSDALSAFDRLINKSHKKVFEKIFETLSGGLKKLGDNSNAQSKAIRELIYLIKDIPMDGKQDYDVLGYIYEDLISKFASNAGKKAGEFYTPHEVSVLMSEIIAYHLKDRKEIKIYDPTSGSGSLLINIGKSVSKYIDGKNNIKYYAQELKENTYNLTRMNLVMRGILPDNIVTRNGDTLEDDWPYFDDENNKEGTYQHLLVDAVVSNPPYSQKWNPEDKEQDPRYAGYGLAPRGKADYAFLLHDLYHVKEDGIMSIVLPHGVLFRGGEEGEIRKNLIENNNIDTIIGLPANIFFGTGIPTIIMVLKHNRINNDVLIIDASKGFIKEGKNNKLRACDIQKIVDVVVDRKNVEKYSKVVSKEEIRANDYNLNIPRYVDSSEKAESCDIYALMYGGIPYKEIDELERYWKAFPGLKEELFKNNSEKYCDLKVSDVKAFIKNYSSVIKFENEFKNNFNDFNVYLKDLLIDSMMDVNISKSKTIIASNISERLDGISLIDYYEAYQLLDDKWKVISSDLEIIQNDGFEAITQVNPNMVTKKKSKEETIVQDGWVGNILPFDLVKSELLSKQTNSIKDKENEIVNISGEIEEIIDSLSEEEKENDFLKESKDEFERKELKKAVKSLDYDDDLNAKLVKAFNIVEKKAVLEKEVKKEVKDLEILTKETIESLSREESFLLLEKKWIDSLMDKLYELPLKIVEQLASNVDKLSQKYSITFSQLEKEIEDTEKTMVTLIDQLDGDDFDMLGLQELKSIIGGGFDE